MRFRRDIQAQPRLALLFGSLARLMSIVSAAQQTRSGAGIRTHGSYRSLLRSIRDPVVNFRLLIAVACVALMASVAPTASAANEGPRIRFTSPQPGEAVTDNTMIAEFVIESRFPIDYLYVEFDPPDDGLEFDGDELPCDPGGASCQISFNLEDTSDGLVEITAFARDVNGVTGRWASVEFILTRYESGAVLYSPRDGDQLSGEVVLKAAPVRGAYGVDFYVDGVRLQGDARYCDGGLECLKWDTRDWANGQHLIAVGGYDGSHDPPGPAIAVTVRNPIETVINMDFEKHKGRISGVIVTLTSVQPPASLRGREVTLAMITPRGTSLVGRKPADANGIVRFDVSATGLVKFSARVDASGDFLAASRTKSARTLAVNFSVSSRNVRVGERFAFTVSVKPSVDAIFWLQTREDGTWSSWKTYELDASGRWRGTGFWQTGPGRIEYRVYVLGTEWFEGSASRSITVRSR